MATIIEPRRQRTRARTLGLQEGDLVAFLHFGEGRGSGLYTCVGIVTRPPDTDASDTKILVLATDDPARAADATGGEAVIPADHAGVWLLAKAADARSAIRRLARSLAALPANSGS